MDHFSANFLGPVEEEYTEEDDGLGYYDDGVKRTLTDAQIAIFRHSEIQALLREQRHAREAMEGDSDYATSPVVGRGEIDEGEIWDESIMETAAASPVASEQNSTRKARKAQQAKQRGFFKQKIKPDLRKRTWDMVDSGMESLDYDEQSSGAPAANPALQRRRISYDD